jgi:hypothetical protein
LPRNEPSKLNGKRLKSGNEPSKLNGKWLKSGNEPSGWHNYCETKALIQIRSVK